MTAMTTFPVLQRPTVDFNRIEIDELFQQYEAIGFIYPGKKALLAPYMPQIARHWKQLQQSKEELLWVFTEDNTARRHFATVSCWRNTMRGMIAQHLASNGNPLLSLRVMLAAQHYAAHQQRHTRVVSSQNWFRPDNRYAYRVFASMYDKLGAQKSALRLFHYLHLPQLPLPSPAAGPYRTEAVTGYDTEVCTFVQNTYDQVFVQAEELDQPDLELTQLNATYQQYGLARRRKVWKIRDAISKKIVACVIANHAPLGLNFSFLEHRAYYILADDLSGRQRLAVCQTADKAVQAFYQDFPLQVVPVVTDPITSQCLQEQGATLVREYMQSIWLRAGFDQWYDHIDSFLSKIERRLNR